jgi:predicted DNA binding CopG/RHH family protein
VALLLCFTVLKLDAHKSETVGVRVSKNLAETIKTVAEARGENVSVFMRRAMKTELARLSFLSEEEKKALGVPA